MNKFLLLTVTVFIAVVGIAHAQTQDAEATADSLFQAQNYQLAVKEYTKAIKLSKKDSNKQSDLYTKRGECKLEMQLIQEAIVDENTAINQNSKNGKAYWTRAMCFERLKVFLQALEDYTAAMPYYANDPINLSILYDNRAYVRLERVTLGGALADATFSLTLNPKNKNAYWNRALIYRVLGKYQSSIDDFRSAMLYEDDKLRLAGLFHNIANNEKSLKQYSKAIDDESTALSLDPQNGRYYMNRASAYQNNKDFLLSVKDIDTAITYFKDDREQLAILYVTKAVNELLLKDTKAALTDDSVSITLNPESGYAYQVRGGIYSSMGDHKTALQDYSKAMTFYTDTKTEYINVYSSYIASEYYLATTDTLITHCKKAIALDPSNISLYFTRGKVYLRKLNNKQAAIKDFEKVVMLDTSKNSTSYLFASYYLGRPEVALDGMKSAILSATNDGAAAGAYYNMACLLSLMNKTEEANAYLRSAIDKGYSKQYAYYDDDLDTIRNTPEFKNLISDSIKILSR